MLPSNGIDMGADCCRTGALLIPLLLMFTSPVLGQGQGLKPVSTHMIEVETGVTLHVVDWGGKGDPLLFLPSWASTSHIFDREYDRAFSARSSLRPVRVERSRTDDAILEACGINDERAFAPGSDDDAANQLGTEWRNTDPAPPYSSVKAPALAFWAPTTARVLQHRLACATAGKLNADVERLLARFTKASIPFFEKEVHDLALFENNMADGSIVIIPGADYNTFLTHPDLVEAEIRLFVSHTDASGLSHEGAPGLAGQVRPDVSESPQ